MLELLKLLPGFVWLARSCQALIILEVSGGSSNERFQEEVIWILINITNVTDADAEIEIVQRAFCTERGVEYVRALREVNSGFALSTKGLEPINGLRYPQVRETTGWYIWSGENFSNSPDFFAPIHTGHIYDYYPDLVNLLGLPPGYRFLLAGDYLDVWYDAKLLNV